MKPSEMKANAEKVFEAIYKNDLDEVKRIIEAGYDVNHRLRYSGTALHFAAELLNLGAIKLLIDSGADLEIRATNQKLTPLSKALEVSCSGKKEKKHRLEVVRYLIEKGADVNAPSNHLGYSPLIIATERSDVELMKFLVSKGADVNYQAFNGTTALHNAVFSRCYIESFKFLVESGADVSLIGPYNMSPLHTAVDMSVGGFRHIGVRGMEILHYLLDCGTRLDAITTHGSNLLDLALTRFSLFEEEEPRFDELKHEFIKKLLNAGLTPRQVKSIRNLEKYKSLRIAV